MSNKKSDLSCSNEAALNAAGFKAASSLPSTSMPVKEWTLNASITPWSTYGGRERQKITDDAIKSKRRLEASSGPRNSEMSSRNKVAI